MEILTIKFPEWSDYTPEGWPLIPHRANQGMGQIDHEHRQIGTIVDRPLFDTHEVFETPILFRVSKIELQLETQTVIVDHVLIAQLQVTTEQHHMRRFVGFQIRLHNHNDIE